MNSTLKKVIAPAAALLAAGVIGGLASVAAWEALDTEPAAAPAAAQATTAEAEPAASSTSESSIANVVDRTLPSVVEVKIEGTSDNTPFPGVPGPQVEGLGSGWVYDDEGHVVTNQHVVDGADKVTVVFEDGTEIGAQVVGSDPSTDVAVLKLDRVPGSVRPLSVGSTSSLELGDPVVAIGSPLGLQGTVTAGIVSGLGRDIEAPDGFTIDGAVQTDAALNHGNSGGPLLNAQGQVIGVNAQIETGGVSQGNVGIGFAIPINTVKTVVAALIKHGKVEHPLLGIEGKTLTPQIARLFHLPVDNGVLVASVRAGTGAAKAGLKPATSEVTVEGETWPAGGDVIVKVDGMPVPTVDRLVDEIASKKPGDKVALEIVRGTSRETVTVKLGRQP